MMVAPPRISLLPRLLLRCRSFPHAAARRRIEERRELATEIPFYGAPRPPSSTDQRNGSSSDTTASGCPAAAATAAERLVRTWQHAVTAVRDPTRADAVAAVGELTGRLALSALLQDMRRDPVGRDILRERPLVSKQTIPYERLMREARELRERSNDESKTGDEDSNTNNDATTTFGQAYGAFLLQHGFDPDERDPVRYLQAAAGDDDDGNTTQEDLAYVMTRYRQCHDFWHALTGLPPTVAGELGLKWLELFQTGMPLAALSCTVGSLSLLSSSSSRATAAADLDTVWNVYLPWARRCHWKMGGQPGKLMNVYYEREWETPVVELRQRLGLEVAPAVVVTTAA